MRQRFITSIVILGVLALPCLAQPEAEKPVELEVLKASLGTWDAEFETWPDGPDSPSIKFLGVETNRAFGEYWIASDLDSEFGGQTTTVHSIVGYDLDRKQLVGTVIDQGPYAAKLTGRYDAESKTVHWRTEGKAPNRNMILQETTITQVSADERVLVLTVPGEEKGKFVKCMKIRYTKRK